MPNPLLNNGAGFRGPQQAYSGSSEFNLLEFVIKSFIGKMVTIILVQVKACTNSGGLAPVGFVDLQVLVKLVDGTGNTFPHGIIYECPYQRIQGGKNAIIIDPEPGDIGIAVFAYADVSSVTANRDNIAGVTDKDCSVPPGSGRRFDWADALYLGGVLNVEPTQYVQFNAEGITIRSPVAVKVIAPDAQVTCETAEIVASTSVGITTPTLTVNGDVNTIGALTNNGVDVGSTHIHSGVSTGVDDSGPPVP